MPRVADSEKLIARLLGRHCAGAARRPGPKAMLEYLRGPARPGRPPAHIDLAARSLLNGCSVPDLLELVVSCRISADRLTAHAEALRVTRKPIVTCLAQLTLQG